LHVRYGVEAGSKTDARVKALSGGQQRRLDLAMSLVTALIPSDTQTEGIALAGARLSCRPRSWRDAGHRRP
jgi:ABC-type branched-subunit amino acid transport system ATPase component